MNRSYVKQGKMVCLGIFFLSLQAFLSLCYEILEYLSDARGFTLPFSYGIDYPGLDARKGQLTRFLLSHITAGFTGKKFGLESLFFLVGMVLITLALYQLRNAQKNYKNAWIGGVITCIAYLPFRLLPLFTKAKILPGVMVLLLVIIISSMGFLLIKFAEGSGKMVDDYTLMEVGQDLHFGAEQILLILISSYLLSIMENIAFFIYFYIPLLLFMVYAYLYLLFKIKIHIKKSGLFSPAGSTK